MYYDDNMRQGYYCDQCNEGCCSSHWIICNDCMYALRMAVFSANEKIEKLEKTKHFVVISHIMNGTITITTTVTIIESETYEEAVIKFKKHCSNKGLSMQYHESENGLFFDVGQSDQNPLSVNGALFKEHCTGHIK